MAALFGLGRGPRAFLPLACRHASELVGGEAARSLWCRARARWRRGRRTDRKREGDRAARRPPQWLVERTRGDAQLGRDYTRTNDNFLSAAGSSTVDDALRRRGAGPARTSAAPAAVVGGRCGRPVVTETFRYPDRPERGPHRHDRRRVARPGRPCRVDRARGARIRPPTTSPSTRAHAGSTRRADVGRRLPRRRPARRRLERISPSASAATSAPAQASRLEAREGLVRLFRDRRPLPAEPVPALRAPVPPHRPDAPRLARPGGPA